jgi:hypothetical protein
MKGWRNEIFMANSKVMSQNKGKRTEIRDWNISV